MDDCFTSVGLGQQTLDTLENKVCFFQKNLSLALAFFFFSNRQNIYLEN